MRFVVFVKQVPDTMAVRLDENGSLVREGVPAILNPYCESALAQVLRLKGEGDTVAAVSMGPDKASAALRRCIELGADEAYLLCDRAFAGADTWATARALAAFANKFEPDADLYAFGRQAIDGDTGQVPYEFAALMSRQQFAYVDSLERDGDGFAASQDYESFRRRCRAPRGSVVSFGTVDPSGCLPTAEGYLRGLRADIKVLSRVDVGLGVYSVGLKGSVTKIVGTGSVKAARRNVKVEITTPSKGAEVLRNELGGAR